MIFKSVNGIGRNNMIRQTIPYGDYPVTCIKVICQIYYCHCILMVVSSVSLADGFVFVSITYCGIFTL